MKITKRQLKRIIREYEVPHESRAFLEDHPDFQRGQDDAMMGYPAMDGATPEYMEGYYDGSELVSPRRLGESKVRLLNEQSDDAAREFEDIMVQIGELVEEAFELANRPESARSYWYNGMLGYIDPERYGIMNRSTSMADTLEEMQADGEEDMMEIGYNDGVAGKEPAHPDNEFYMINYEDGQREARGRP